MPTFDDAFALVVGIADYRHVRKLPAVNDADAIVRVLTDPTRCGYKPENVRCLKDEVAGREATRDNIRAGLAWLAERAGPAATAVVYFSGHGEQIGGTPYLLPVETAWPGDAEMAASAIPDVEFTADLAPGRLKARKVFVALDCCHSGGLGAAKNAAPPAPAPEPLTDFDRLHAGDGRVVLASSRADEKSWVLPGDSYGLFTKHLLAGLEGGAAAPDGLVRVFELFQYVQPRVVRERPGQRPYFRAEVGENFALALAPARPATTPAEYDPGFLYDAYISFADAPADKEWVGKVLVPRLEAAGLRVAVAHDIYELGVPTVKESERVIRASKRTLVVLSDRYLADNAADFDNVLAQTMGIQEGTYRVLPVVMEPVGKGKLPTRLGMLTAADLTDPARLDKTFDKIVKALRGPLPTRKP